MRVAVIGAGSWGTAVANMLAHNGHDVHIWAREADVVRDINSTHENTVFLAGTPLHPGLVATARIREAVADAHIVVTAMPSKAVRRLVSEIRTALPTEHASFVSISKGLEPKTFLTCCQVIDDICPDAQVAALSGPSFAVEVARGAPTAVVVATSDGSFAEELQRVFANATFRVYRTDDRLGVELGGALKNVIAIAAGLVDGLKLGDNARAAVVTRGLAEITRLGVALGASRETFAGLAGLGDLVLTATGDLSRNRQLGLAVAAGASLTEALEGKVSVAEGAHTAQTVIALGEKVGVELPIAQAISSVLFDGVSPSTVTEGLMGRELKAELYL